jgi:hypothetical protein
MDDPFDRWESEFADDENARLQRILEDHRHNSREGSGNEPQLEWNTVIKRWQRRWRRDR